MPKIQITARNVFKNEPHPIGLPAPEKGRLDYLDAKTPGLALRVTSSDHRSWCVVYRFKGIRRRFTLGDLTEAHGLQWARDEAETQVFEIIAKGIDPGARKASDRKAETFKELATAYLEEHAKAKKRSWKADHNIIHKDLIPRFGTRKAPDIARREIRDMLKAIRQRGAPIQANRTLEVTRKLFNWAIGEEIIEHNPCDHIPKPSKENKRERVLTADEIRTIWNALPKIDPIMAATYKLRFLTGLRGNEVMDMERGEIDGNIWTIPTARLKNGRSKHAQPLRVPLTPAMLAIITEMEQHNRSGKRIFPGRGKTGLKFTVYYAQEELQAAAAIADWTPHDIRHTVATNLGALGFSRFIIGRILNHIDASVTGRYDQHSYDAEKRTALEAWGRRLEEIISGKSDSGNVTTFPVRGVTVEQPA
jgi:integrase